MPKYNFTEEQEKEIIEFYLEPNSAKDTIKHFNCGCYCMDKILQKYNIPKHSKEILSLLESKRQLVGKITPKDENSIISFYLAPNSLERTANNFNISTTAVSFILKKHNIMKHSEETAKKLCSNSKKNFSFIINNEQEIISYYLIPNSIQSTAEKFNITRKAVEKILKANEIKKHEYLVQKPYKRKGRKVVKQLSEIEEHSIIAFYLIPNTLIKTAKTFKITPKRVKKVLVSNNIQLHPKSVTLAIGVANYRKYFEENYGVVSPSQLEEIKEKIKQTNLEKYGETSYTKTKEYKERTKQTNLKKYGVEYTFQANEIKEKIAKTNLERYGSENVSNNKTIREKAEQTIINKYGVYHAPTYNYRCDNLSFDSFPELCFYLYHIKNNIKIIREPVTLDFIFDNKIYHYTPDFEINNSLIEIKGSQFLKEDGT